MPDTSKNQKVQELLESPVDRASYDELVRDIYASFRSVDQANDRLKGMLSALESARDDEQRDLHEQIGILSCALGEYARAREHLEAVKGRKEAAHFLGRVYLELGRVDEAVSALEAGRRADEDLVTDLLMVDALCSRR